jgi:hypothetical protein
MTDMKDQRHFVSVLDIVAGISPVAANDSRLTEHDVAMIRERLAAFRAHDNWRRENAAEAVAGDPRPSDIDDALIIVERELAYWSPQAVLDPATGLVCQIATSRVAVLTARKAHLLALMETFPRP